LSSFLEPVWNFCRRCFYNVFDTQTSQTIYMGYSIWATPRPDGWFFNFVEYYEKISNREFKEILQCMTRSIENTGIPYYANVGTRKFSFETNRAHKMNIFESTWALGASDLYIAKVARFVEEAKQLGHLEGQDCDQ